MGMSDKAFPFTVQFTARVPINPATGIIPGVTVAEIGVATGHFAFLDRENAVLGVGGMADAPNFKGALRRLPLCMDAKSLDTVVAAGKAANRVKAREDHDDSVGARAGYGANFRLEEGKAVCDMTVFAAYRNRGVFMETAAETPELIGLSGDFKFNAEIKGDCAFMRVVKIEAVDIVDKGALTHAGLFAAKVDIPEGGATQLSIMAKSKNAAGDDIPDMDAFKVMCESIAAYRAKHKENDIGPSVDECMAMFSPEAIKPVPVPTPSGAPAPANSTNTMTAAEKTALTTELTASMSALVDTAVKSAVTTATAEFQKQFSALGLKPAAVPAPAPAATEPVVPPAAVVKTDFLSLKASVAKERNISPSEAARVVMNEKPEAYREYQIKLGIIKAA